MIDVTILYPVKLNTFYQSVERLCELSGVKNTKSNFSKKMYGDVKLMFHSDGAILPLLDDFVDMGVDILNPVQTSVSGLEDTFALKEKYGDRLCFHGAIDVQQMMPNATADELEAEIARRIYDLGRGGGYILAPCHNIGHDISPENVVALFEQARQLGADPEALADRVARGGSYFEVHGVRT